MIELFNMLKPY